MYTTRTVRLGHVTVGAAVSTKVARGHVGSILSTTSVAVASDMSRTHSPIDEAHNDFYGLPSNPVSIFHTGPAWPLPTGPQAQRIPKEARPVCNHPIALVWNQLGTQIYEHFDSVGLKWTTIDPVRFAEAGGVPGPLFLWVGVVPGTLSRDDAKVAAVCCQKILADYEIMDVEIAFRESVFTRSTGPKLLNHVLSVHPTADVRIPFTPALGLQIARKTFPYFEGTGCLYLCEGGDSDRVFLLTARHVVLPLSKHSNDIYHRKRDSAPRFEVIHLGSRAYHTALKAIEDKIRHDAIVAGFHKDEINSLGVAVEDEDVEVTAMRQASEDALAKVEKSEARVNEFYDDITKFWTGEESQRVLGCVLYAPPISVSTGNKRFTEDWALVALDRGKFDWDAFRGNVIYLGTKLTAGEFMDRMYPHPESCAKFKYPVSGLMQLRGFVKDSELRSPSMLDGNGEKCLIVVKNGAGSGLTFGRATGIESFVRAYDEDGIHSTSMEIAVYPYSRNDGVFSTTGDSGSVVADANNRIIGMITGGAGLTDSTDVTYVSPYYFLDERIKRMFPKSYLYPILA